MLNCPSSNYISRYPEAGGRYTSAGQVQGLIHYNMDVENSAEGKHSGLSEDEIVEIYGALDEVFENGDDRQKELANNLKNYMDDLIDTYGTEDKDNVVSYNINNELHRDGIYVDLQYEKGSIQQHMFKQVYGYNIETAVQLQSILSSDMGVHDLSAGKQSGLTQEEIDNFYLAADYLLENGDDKQKELTNNLKNYMDDLIETYGTEGQDIVVSYDDYLTLNSASETRSSLQYEKGSIQKYAAENKEPEENVQKNFFGMIFDKIKALFTK